MSRAGLGFIILIFSVPMTLYTYDFGVTKIVSPPATVSLGASFVPACSVHNFDGDDTDCLIRMKIGDLCNNSVTVANLPPGAYRLVTFPAWTAGGKVGMLPEKATANSDGRLWPDRCAEEIVEA